MVLSFKKNFQKGEFFKENQRKDDSMADILKGDLRVRMHLFFIFFLILGFYLNPAFSQNTEPPIISPQNNPLVEESPEIKRAKETFRAAGILLNARIHDLDEIKHVAIGIYNLLLNQKNEQELLVVRDSISRIDQAINTVIGYINVNLEGMSDSEIEHVVEEAQTFTLSLPKLTANWERLDLDDKTKTGALELKRLDLISRYEFLQENLFHQSEQFKTMEMLLEEKNKDADVFGRHEKALAQLQILKEQVPLINLSLDPKIADILLLNDEVRRGNELFLIQRSFIFYLES